MEMNDVVFKNTMVFDGSGSERFPADVRVSGNRIVKIAPADTIDAAGAIVVDGSGSTLMPGLVEAHAHISWPSAYDRIIHDMNLPAEENLLIAARNAGILLDHGFTSAYSAGALGLRFDVAIRNEIDAGWIPGPRMRASSLERAPKGAFGVPETHDDEHEKRPEAMKAFVRLAKSLGVDTIKVLISGDDSFASGGSQVIVYTDEQLAAVHEQSLESDIWLACHAHASESIKMGARNGFRVFYHCTYADEEALDMLEARKSEIFVAPAVGLLVAWLENPPEAAGEDVFGAAKSIELMKKVMPEMVRRGIRVLPGGDYGFGANPQGRNARDIQHFVELFGLSPHQALMSATKLGGEIMGMEDELGLVKEGYLADLLLVDGDPTEDVSILQDKSRLTVIMKDGQFHKKADTPARTTAREVHRELAEAL
jgi:imidazolonepropionase-like amidohydrolase